MTDHQRRAGRGWLPLGGLLLLFLGPVAVALLFYANPQLVPEGTTNHGALVNPGQQLEVMPLVAADGRRLKVEDLRGKWTFLHVETSACPAECGEHLYNTRQVRLAQGRDMGRVQRLLVLTDGPAFDTAAALRDDHPGLMIASGDAALLSAFLGQLPAGASEGWTYLVDPQGNLVMMYAPAAAATGMLDDLRHLLRVSLIG